MVINLMNIQKERKLSMNTKWQLTNTTESQKGTKQDFLQKTWVVCALALVCTFLWGSASPCIKLGYALFQIPSSETWTQVLFAGTRFILAGVLTVLIGRVVKTKMLVSTKSTIKNTHMVVLVSTKPTLTTYFYMSAS